MARPKVTNRELTKAYGGYSLEPALKAVIDKHGGASAILRQFAQAMLRGDAGWPTADVGPGPHVGVIDPRHPSRFDQPS